MYIFLYTLYIHTVLKYSRNRVYQVKQSSPVEAETRHRSALKSPFNMISFPVDKGKRENEGVGLFGFHKKIFDSLSRSTSGKNAHHAARHIHNPMVV